MYKIVAETLEEFSELEEFAYTELCEVMGYTGVALVAFNKAGDYEVRLLGSGSVAFQGSYKIIRKNNIVAAYFDNFRVVL